MFDYTWNFVNFDVVIYASAFLRIEFRFFFFPLCEADLMEKLVAVDEG